MNCVIVEGRAVQPSKIVCIGRNYVAHIEELGNDIPSDMVIFVKPNSAITSDLNSFLGEPLHYEAEIALLVENNQFSSVGVGLDLTKRKLQTQLKLKGLPWERAKAFDGAALFSHFVALPKEVNCLTVELNIDGALVQSGGIDSMMYQPSDILRELQLFMTLNDGDIVMTGTPKGVGKVSEAAVFDAKIQCKGIDLVSASWVAIGPSSE